MEIAVSIFLYGLLAGIGLSVIFFYRKIEKIKERIRDSFLIKKSEMDEALDEALQKEGFIKKLSKWLRE